MKKLNERCTIIDRHRERKSTLLRDLRPQEKKKPFKFGCAKMEELAQQLTQWEHHIYSSIPYQEFHCAKWLCDAAPFLQFHLSWFDNVVRWLSFEILDAPTKEDRVSTVKQVISLGWKLKSLNNYNGIMQVLCCLHSLPIARLHSCWTALPLSMHTQTHTQTDRDRDRD
jgi:hypothetical protein